MKKLLFFFFLFASIGLEAQPGHREVCKNLNDYTPAEIKQSRHSDFRTSYTFIVDSTTDLSKISSLRILPSISLMVKVKVLPKEFSSLSDSLKYLKIDASGKLSDITALKQLKNLASIKIENYAGADFPALDELTNLNDLYLTGDRLKDVSNLTFCKMLTDLTIISESFSVLPVFSDGNKIDRLSLSINKNCIDLSALTSLHTLKTLYINNAGIKKLPSNFGQTLEDLSLVNCLQLEDITVLNKCTNLKRLVINNSGLKLFETDLSKSKIEYLNISGNADLKKIGGIASLYLLKDLELQGLDAVEALNFDMSRMNITKLRLDSLKSLKDISGISGCKSLKEIQLDRLGSIKTLDFDMSKMNVEDLSIGQLRNLKNLDCISGSKSLKKLELWDITIQKLPGNMSNMENLESFQLSLTQLSDIGDLKNMKSLKSVDISMAPNLKTLPKSFNTNLKIESVKFFWAKNLVAAEGLTNLKNLKSIDIGVLNPKFTLPQELNTCENLEAIVIRSGVDDLSMINNLHKLKKLVLDWCSFSALPDEIYSNENIRDLEICYNDFVKDLSSVVLLKNLKRLDIEDNNRLTTIPDLYNKVQLIARSNKKLKIPDSYKGGEWGYMIEANDGFVNAQ